MSKSNFTNEEPQELPEIPPEPPISIVNNSKVEWSGIYRDAKDTAANSILSRHVLKKSVELLVDGRGNIGEMNNATENVKHSIQDLKLELNGISDISKLSKMIAINLAIESNRLGKNGTTFGTIASEMQRLDASISQYISEIDKRILVIAGCLEISLNIAKNVNQLFFNTDMELTQFRNLMLRIEDLSVSQTQKLENLEKKLTG